VPCDVPHLKKTANNQQPTNNSRQPTANSQQPTANSQQIPVACFLLQLSAVDCLL
jgi:hypothetical protein